MAPPEGYASEQPEGFQNHIKRVAIVGVSKHPIFRTSSTFAKAHR